MANNEKAFMWKVTVMNLASIWSYFCTYLHAIQCWSENFLLWMGEVVVGGGGRDQYMYLVLFTRH